MRKIIKTLAAAMGVAILLLPTKTYAQDKFTALPRFGVINLFC